MTSTSPGHLTIGYLQVGVPRHGICRYGRFLAAEGRQRTDVAVLERHVTLSDDFSADRRCLEAVAEYFSETDVVHIQVSVSGDGTWGRNGRALRNLRTFRRRCRAPLIVTLHDVNNLRALGYSSAVSWLRRGAIECLKIPVRPAVRAYRQLRRSDWRPGEVFSSLSDFGPLYPYLITRWSGHNATALIVLSGEEKRTLDAMQLARRVTVIPHFIEDAPLLPRLRSSPKTSRKTVIMAGFVFKNKGYDIMLEAMSLLPDVDLVLVGGPRFGVEGADTASRLMDLARRRGVAERVRLTGYLEEEEYQRHLASADLAVCPFERDKSASGSLSSLIAAGCPILASAIPLIAEYNALAPGAIATFSPYTAAALSEAIRESLGKPRDNGTRSLAELRQLLGIARIYDQHVQIYQDARAARSTGSWSLRSEQNGGSAGGSQESTHH